tara:strand:+ start:4434 stop:5150 length:717 start_codon:yes stop_codon:yes gene_type:complete
MKHSIYTVLNSAYMIFGKIFIQSYLEHNSEKCNYIFVLDAGLKEDDILWLQQFDKIKIIGSDVKTSFKNGNTSTDWTDTVVAKTYGLREILNTYGFITPLIMIDSDCLVLQDISSLIDQTKDIQICNRPEHETPMLGSYVSINRRCPNFMDRWINIIPTISTPWKESPALSKAYLEFKNHLSIGLIPEHIVSCYKKEDVNEDVRIVHFKSGAAHKTIEESIQKRIYERGFGQEVKRYV